MANPNVLDEVFESFVNGVKLFKDREVLRTDYVPEKLPHREEQIKLLGQTVAPVLKNARCSNIFIYGKTGTGKTAVAKHVLSHLEFKAKEYGSLGKILLHKLQNDRFRIPGFRGSKSKCRYDNSFHGFVGWRSL